MTVTDEQRADIWREDARNAATEKLLATKDAEIARLREALIRLRDCDWVISLPDRMDAVRDIARAALEQKP